ncbi:hypothetical protein EPJ64_00835 [Brachyspira aalborgi]|uniref:Uncharacterized protein n=2 Tax=Brachyspira aalborgi TaxID=29522 RepID=A0ABY3KBS2_9SPIR|nr:hypothetical protein [Brachyspira aalborgi]TXJ16623.1 hypothetical protein EPJ77_02570 [Brachyspira aalborgi]TXJ22727.1 hypothetical protein EPJ64_00835 [Brachyspira aalborgi]TXJ34356.1 hypothetical protein EPJ71_00365 [Brachyspira aalborgi]TXJ50430.1 hypothetical protein EPJ75_02640 [Brachyspira aalborgi]
MFMENKEKYEITFKLQSNNVNLENLKSSETSKIASDFLKSIEKADKNIKLKMIKFGSIACTLEVNKSFTENKIFQKVKDNIRSFINYNNSIEWVDIVDKSNEVIETIKNSSLDENISLNVVGFFQGRVNDIGGKEPNINIHIDINNYSVIFPIPNKDIEIAKTWRNYLYEEVEIYAEVKQDEYGRIIEGIEIFKLEPIEILDKVKVKKDFNDLIGKLKTNNLTQTIINMRHKNE